MKFQLVILLLSLYFNPIESNKYLKVAFLTDVHIGEGCNKNLTLESCKPMAALAAAFDYLNTLDDIDGVFLSGDLTSSALYEEYAALRNLLEKLKLPWWPLLGKLGLVWVSYYPLPSKI